MPESPARKRGRIVSDVGVALLLMLVAAATAELLYAVFGLTRLAILFLAAVTVAAGARGPRGALISAIVGVILYKVFLDFRTGDRTGVPEDVLNLLVFLVVALITGTLAGRLHDQAARAERRATRMALLLNAARILSDEDEQSNWTILVETLSDAAGAAALAFDASGSLRGASGQPTSQPPKSLVQKLLQWRCPEIIREERFSGRCISANGQVIGVLVWEIGEPDAELDDVVELLVELASASNSRKLVHQEQVKATAAQQAATLREALLSSISHDFRSPLSAIIGSATSLLEYGDKFDEAVRRDLLLNIQHEGEKLNQFVTTLLNMSRLQAGVIEPDRRPVSVDEVVRDAIERLKRHKREELPVQLEGACMGVADPLLLEQAVYNILDNAVKYASSSAEVRVSCATKDDCCQIVIADEGPGLTGADQTTVFGKYTSSATKNGEGTGLGLFIAKEFVEANGGTITARGRSDLAPGLELVITVPRPPHGT